MQEEITALLKNRRWELVPKPEDVEPVTCNWLCKLNIKSDGTIDRSEARLVTRGFAQQYGLNMRRLLAQL